jgi:hypothetical protein
VAYFKVVAASRDWEIMSKTWQISLFQDSESNPTPRAMVQGKTVYMFRNVQTSSRHTSGQSDAQTVSISFQNERFNNPATHHTVCKVFALQAVRTE